MGFANGNYLFVFVKKSQFLLFLAYFYSYPFGFYGVPVTFHQPQQERLEKMLTSEIMSTIPAIIAYKAFLSLTVKTIPNTVERMNIITPTIKYAEVR